MVSPVGFRGRRRSRRPFFRRSTGGTEWVSGHTLFSLAAPASPTNAFPIVPNAVIKGYTSPTFLGGYLTWAIQATQLDGDLAPSFAFVYMGLRVQPERTTLAGPDAGPLPFSDGEASWPWHRQIMVSNGLPDPAAIATAWSDSNFVRGADRVRSKRRLTDDDELVLITELSGVGAFPPSGGICVSVAFRLLIKET